MEGNEIISEGNVNGFTHFASQKQNGKKVEYLYPLPFLRVSKMEQ